MTTRRETIMSALTTQLANNMPGITVEREQEEPQVIPSGGWVNLEEAEAELLDELLGGSSSFGEWSLTVEANVLVQSADAANRNTTFDSILEAIGSAIGVDRTLGGACEYVEILEPGGVEVRDIDGAASIRSAVIQLNCYYETTENPFASV